MSLWHCPSCNQVGGGGPDHTNICGVCGSPMSISQVIDISPQDIPTTYVRTASGTPEEIAAKRAQFEEDRKYRLTHSDYQMLEVALGFSMGWLCDQSLKGDKRFETYSKLFDKIEYHKEKTK